MSIDYQNLKKLADFAKNNKLHKIKVDDIEIEISAYYYAEQQVKDTEERLNAEMNMPEEEQIDGTPAESLSSKTFVDELEEDESDEELLMWSAN